jgi:hypothetical protein
VKKVAFGLIIGSLLLSLVALSTSAAGNGNSNSCTTIQDGELDYSAGHYLEGEPLQVGYDIFGYNYQAHMFKGSYANAYLGGGGFPPYEGDDEAYYQRLVDESISGNVTAQWYWPYRDVQLIMKWNDAWLSNKDCDGDGKLDRYYGFDTYIGSGAWETNHQSGSYEEDGKIYKWNYFVKIVAVPADATKIEGIWYTADGTEIGPDEWGAFAVIMRVYNDQGTGDHGIEYLSPAGPGFGKW